MNKFPQFIKTIRLSNLLMIALVQWIVSVYFVKEYQFYYYLLISSTTIFIALAAYLLNDIADIEIDKINNKLKLINNDNKSTWFKIVITLNLLGLVLGFLVSSLSQISLFIYFALAVVLLSAYAYFLSKYKVIGNLIISFLIALSILLCFYLEIKHPYFDRMYYSDSEINVWVYAAFAFLLNWLREIVKDMEDMEGDKAIGRVSIPILMGLNISKFLSAIIMLFFASIFALLAYKMNLEKFVFIYLSTLLVYSLFILIYLIYSKSIEQFSKLSFKIKLLMLASLLLPLILSL